MNICLHPTSEADLNFVLSAEQAQDNCAFVGQWQRQQHHEALFNQDIAHLVIESTTDSKLVGYAILVGLEDADLCINLKRFVVTEKSQGYGKQALHLIKKLAFEELQAHRLWLDVKDFNLRARHLYETAGFVIEGVLRECIKTGDAFESLVLMSMLREEYYSQRFKDSQLNEVSIRDIAKMEMKIKAKNVSNSDIGLFRFLKKDQFLISVRKK